MSQEKDKSQRTAIVAIMSAIFVAFVLVGLGYAAYVNSDIKDEIAKPEVEDDLSSLDTDDNDLPPLTKPVDGEEIQDKIDELSDDLKSEKSQDKKLDTNQLSDEKLGL